MVKIELSEIDVLLLLMACSGEERKYKDIWVDEVNTKAKNPEQLERLCSMAEAYGNVWGNLMNALLDSLEDSGD